MERDIIVPTYLYMKLQDGETLEDALDRMCYGLASVGIDADVDEDACSIMEY